MTDPSIWNQLLVWPIINLLMVFHNILQAVGIPGAFGFAIILLTVSIRLLLYPLMAKQMKSARDMQKLKPKLDELSKKHKDDRGKLQQAQLSLYQEHGINPAAGCLPMLVQFPVLIALYRVFFQLLNDADATQIVEQINQVVYTASLQAQSIDTSFFGIGLNMRPSQWQTAGVWLLSIPLITAGLQWYQTRLMTQTAASKQPEETSKKNEKKGDKEESPQDTAAEIQKQMALITPLMFGFFAYQFPVGLALYWNTFSAFGIIQQIRINREE